MTFNNNFITYLLDIENKDIHGKKCSEYPMLDKQWYIEQVYDRLKLFNIDARPSMFDSMF